MKNGEREKFLFVFLGRKRERERGGRFFWEKERSAMWFFPDKNFLLISKHTPLARFEFQTK